MEYYSAMKNNELMPFEATWMGLEMATLREISQRQKKKLDLGLTVTQIISLSWQNSNLN